MRSAKLVAEYSRPFCPVAPLQRTYSIARWCDREAPRAVRAVPERKQKADRSAPFFSCRSSLGPGRGTRAKVRRVGAPRTNGENHAETTHRSSSPTNAGKWPRQRRAHPDRWEYRRSPPRRKALYSLGGMYLASIRARSGESRYCFRPLRSWHGLPRAGQRKPFRD